MPEKNDSVKAKLLQIKENTTGIHSMSASRAGFGMSMAGTTWMGVFETEKDGILELILTERQAEKLHIGMTGTVYYKNQKFIRIL